MATQSSQPELRLLLQRFYDPEVIQRDGAGWPGGLLRLLAEFGALGDARVLPHVLSLIEDEDRRVAEAASTAIVEILARASPADLVVLDPILRGGWTGYDSQRSGWDRLDPESLDRQLDSGQFPPAWLGLASMHPDGYVREAAVRRLAERSDGSELHYLLIRLNDWVPAVRATARAILLNRLHPGYARHFVHNLSLVTRLAECSRDDHSSFVALVMDCLRDPRARPALLEGLSSPDRAVCRACFRLAIEAPDVSSAEFLGRAILHDDPVIRLWAAGAARARLAVEEYLGLHPIIARDRFMPVRREALVGLVKRCPGQCEPALRASLLNPQVSIREVARYYLGKSGDFDSPSFYRAAVRSVESEALPPAIAGLGETGTKEDAGLVLPWLTHPASKIRRAAVRVLGRLDGDSYIEELLIALKDERSSVSRIARESLCGRLPLVAEGRLWTIFERDRRPHVRRHTLSLLAGLPKWTRLTCLIRACSDDEPEMAMRARGFLQDWIRHFNRSFSRPSSEELHQAVAAVDASSSALSTEVIRLLRFHLQGW